MSAESGHGDRSALTTPPMGDLKDVQVRSVQMMGGSENCLGVNLSNTGSVILGITADDDVTLRIYENGIWVSRSD